MSMEHEEHSGDSDGFAGYHVNMVPWTSIWPATFIRSFPPVLLNFDSNSWPIVMLYWFIFLQTEDCYCI